MEREGGSRDRLRCPGWSAWRLPCYTPLLRGCRRDGLAPPAPRGRATGSGAAPAGQTESRAAKPKDPPATGSEPPTPLAAFPALERLVGNLWWTWTPEARAFVESVHPRSWRESRGVIRDYFDAVPEERWAQLAGTPAFLESLADIDARLTAYLADEGTWWATNFAGRLPGGIAYLSPEYAIHEGLPLYSGGLGIVAGDHLKSASDLGVPLVAAGLYYREGYFTQRLDEQGRQAETYPSRSPRQVGLLRALGAGGQPLEVFVQLEDRHVRCEVWLAQLGRVPLYLLDTDVDGNREGDRQLCRRLYGGDQDTRIRQEVILGIGGLRALRGAGHAPSVVHLNEGHTAFAILERVREEMGRGVDRPRAWEVARSGTVFTTHTPVAAGHDRFWADLVGRVLGPFDSLLSLSTAELLDLGRVHKGSSEELCMPVLALRGSRTANAVSGRHGEVSRELWGGLDGVPGDLWIEPVTVGVHAPSWVGPEMQSVLDQYVGPTWRQRQQSGRRMDAIEDVPARALWMAHARQKQRLVQFVAHRAGRRIDPRALVIGTAQRFAAFKRGDLLLSDPERLAALLTDPQRPVVVLYAGKAHPRDESGKAIIRRVLEVAAMEETEGRVVFVEDYDIAVGRAMVQGVDLWLGTPRRTQEATGLSGQKAAINGALNCATLAGWWMEGFAMEPMAGWAIGRKSTSRDEAVADRQDASDLYRTLEDEIVPMFWDRSGDDVPDEWVRWMSAAMATFLPAFHADRMVADYVVRSYLAKEKPDAAPPPPPQDPDQAEPAPAPAPAPAPGRLSRRRR